MIERLKAAALVAFTGIVASTGTAAAYSDETEVMVGTGVVVIATLVVVSIGYALKKALRLDPPLPPYSDDHSHGHH